MADTGSVENPSRRFLLDVARSAKSASALVKEAYQTGKTVREVAREKSGIPEARLKEVLDPTRQSGEG